MKNKQETQREKYDRLTNEKDSWKCVIEASKLLARAAALNSVDDVCYLVTAHKGECRAMFLYSLSDGESPYNMFGMEVEEPSSSVLQFCFDDKSSTILSMVQIDFADKPERKHGTVESELEILRAAKGRILDEGEIK